MDKTEIKLLFLDIETSPNIGYFWGLFDQNISIEQVAKPGETLCWAARPMENNKLGKMQYSSSYGDGRVAMVKKVWKLLDWADAVVHYNGTQFDMKILNKEFLLQKLPPPSPYHQIDLLLTFRRMFKMMSNKLDFVAPFLGLEGKIKHKGMALWTGCMEKDPASWRMMEKYNKQDVNIMPGLYKILLPWINNHPNMGLYTEDKRPVCTNCGSSNVVSKGIEPLTTQTYQRWKCGDCGNNMRGRVTILDKEKRKAMLVNSRM